MKSKVEDWDTQLHQDKPKTCEKCGTKLKNKQEDRQIATRICDVNYKRYRSYCPKCKLAEYPLDRVLKLRPRQRLSNSVEELSVLCGASWDYGHSEYIMKKVLNRFCVIHETIFNRPSSTKQTRWENQHLWNLRDLR